MPMQPHYWELPAKLAAREENAAVYRRLTGNHSIPKDKGYWTLCNEQPLKKGAEIVQLCDIGLISKNQFFGVDWDEKIIAENKLAHPIANWFCGDWIKVIRDCDDFNPAFVYLDSTKFADHVAAANLVASTMHFCGGDTVLLANMMLNDPRSRKRFDYRPFVHHLSNIVGPIELGKWSPNVECYCYNGSGKTEMITYILHKLED